MSRGYDPESLKAEAERLTRSVGEETIDHRVANAHKHLEALSMEIGSLEEKLTPIMRPENMKITAGAVTAESIGERNISPLANELDSLTYRMGQLRSRLHELFERVDL